MTDANRCGLGAGQRAIAEGLLHAFPEHAAFHAAGGYCHPEDITAPVIVDWDGTGAFTYA